MGARTVTNDLPTRIALDGDRWLFRSFLGDEWQSARLGEPARAGRGGWLPATVPGSVVADLFAAREVPDPYRGLNSRFAEWAAERWWAYQTEFEAPRSAAGERYELVLEGIDYAGRVYLDGELLGEHAGMFVPACFELGDRLRDGGRHVLAVLIAPAPREESQTGDTARVRTHKTRMSYGWDFCPRLVHQGIWQPVWLRRTGPVRIEQPFVRPRLSADRAAALVECTLRLHGAEAVRVRVAATVGLADGPAASTAVDVDVPAGSGNVRLDVPLPAPALWWPNGYGEQPLYEAEISVAVDGACSDLVRAPFGVRSLRFERNADAPPDARPYTFVVNDVPVYANGWNWVPVDMLYGVPRPAKLEHLLRLARDARVNLLRVWGGGLIESEEFYAACDRLGIMVWQEFIQSSSGSRNEPSSDPEFVAMMVRQAESIVARRRNHASLALWCGGNELMRDGRPLDESTPVLGALADVVRRLDPDRAFLPTSPSGPIANFVDVPVGEMGHDVHGPWEHQGLNRQPQLYDERGTMLHSEFGVEGMSNRAAIEATIPGERRWPATRDNPVYSHRGAWWINEPLVQAAFGGGIDDLPTLVRASQFLQADGLRYAIEAHLRRRWRSSGTLPWQFNEPFPNAWCTSAVDYYGRPKPAYHAVAAAYEPVHVSASFERQVWAGSDPFGAALWVSNSTREPIRGLLVARVVGADGAQASSVEREVSCAPRSAVALGEVTARLDEMPSDVFLLDLALRAPDGRPMSLNRYVFSRTADLAPMRALPPVVLDVSRTEDGPARWELRLRNAGGCVAPAVRIEDARPVDTPGWAVPNEDLVSLLPGEERVIGIAFRDVPAAQRRLAVSGWNVEERLVD